MAEVLVEALRAKHFEKPHELCKSEQVISKTSPKRHKRSFVGYPNSILKFIIIYLCVNFRPGSSVGIATDYGLDGPGSNPGGDEISTRPDWPWGPPSLL